MFRQFLRDESGATAIEYGLIAALVALVLVASLGSIGESLAGFFDSATTKINSAKTP